MRLSTKSRYGTRAVLDIALQKEKVIPLKDIARRQQISLSYLEHLVTPLIVNGILKPYWGRPRPNQIQELGGQYVYRHVLNPGIPGKGKSFPSGHSTMGFIFVSLIYFHRKSRSAAWIGGISGIVYGSVISAARVVQGAHFVTDCIWSLGVIWMVATISYYHVLRIPSAERKIPRQLTRRQKRIVSVVIEKESHVRILFGLGAAKLLESQRAHVFAQNIGHLRPLFEDHVDRQTGFVTRHGCEVQVFDPLAAIESAPVDLVPGIVRIHKRLG